jgi:hypothetical protein
MHLSLLLSKNADHAHQDMLVMKKAFGILRDSSVPQVPTVLEKPMTTYAHQELIEILLELLHLKIVTSAPLGSTVQLEQFNQFNAMMVLIAQKELLPTSQYQEVTTVTQKLNSRRHLVHLTLGAQEEQRSQSHALEEFFVLPLVRLAIYAQLVAMFKIIQPFNWQTHALFVLLVSTLPSRMSNASHAKPVTFAWEELLDSSQQAGNTTMVSCVQRVTIAQQIGLIQLSAQ